ncbi:hypothetical protein ACFX5U_12425 [Sphingobacterium sp. SG20118]|uniref:hypothetical protein n=1 Tax=Sphingobacterium sp. SG20118 TaxID=3367156 RepID=UPI0037DFC10D
MRKFQTVVAALAMVVAIGGAIAAGQTTKAPTVYISNGIGNPPTPVDLALKDAPAGTPGAWECTETELTSCYFHDSMLTDSTEIRGEYRPL